MVASLQNDAMTWSIFEDRSATLIRIIMTLISLLLISAESIDHDKFNYRKRIKVFLLIIFLCEIISYGLQLNYYPLTQRWIRKIGVELIFIILNCSIIYHQNKFLGNNPSTLSRIFYGTAILLISTGLLPHHKYGRLTYAANSIVSFYSLIILYRLKSYFHNLSTSKFNILITIPVSHIALFRLEIIIFILNITVYGVSLYYGEYSYNGWHIIHQFSACICLMYLIKIYIVVIEWRGHNSLQFEDNNKHKIDKQNPVIIESINNK